VPTSQVLRSHLRRWHFLDFRNSKKCRRQAPNGGGGKVPTSQYLSMQRKFQRLKCSDHNRDIGTFAILGCQKVPTSSRLGAFDPKFQKVPTSPTAGYVGTSSHGKTKKCQRVKCTCTQHKVPTSQVLRSHLRRWHFREFRNFKKC